LENISIGSCVSAKALAQAAAYEMPVEANSLLGFGKFAGSKR